LDSKKPIEILTEMVIGTGSTKATKIETVKDLNSEILMAIEMEIMIPTKMD